MGDGGGRNWLLSPGGMDMNRDQLDTLLAMAILSIAIVALFVALLIHG